MATQNLIEMRDAMRTMQIAMQTVTDQLGVLSQKIDALVVVCNTDKTAELTCIEPFYEKCIDNPDVCVHKLIEDSEKKEVCGVFKDRKIGKNAIIRSNEEMNVQVRAGSRLRSTESKFPVAHSRTLALNKRNFEGMDPSSI